MTRRPAHWPEYLIDGSCLALFMVSATVMATLLQHPASPLAEWNSNPLLQRVPMGVAMGLTCVALIYSPLGARSGAHMNPAVTLTFLRLGKMAPWDAAGYVGAQFAGGAIGVLAATWALDGLPADPAVNFVATVPGDGGSSLAFAAELVISFVMMMVVLQMTNRPRLARFTGLVAGLLVTFYIVFEAPLSGMSMNPARTLGSNALAADWSPLWIYFTAPPLGMLLAAEWFRRRHGIARVRCAKLHHARSVPCHFHRCAHEEPTS
jgi:aquaporin Z